MLTKASALTIKLYYEVTQLMTIYFLLVDLTRIELVFLACKASILAIELEALMLSQLYP